MDLRRSASILLASLCAGYATGAELCRYDYKTTKVNGASLTEPPIEITGQGVGYVDFEVQNVWTSASPIHEVYIEYHQADGYVDCLPAVDLAPSATLSLRAVCFHDKPVSVVSVYLRDPAFTATPGSGEIPQCCHADGSITAPVMEYQFLLKCENACEDDPEDEWTPPVDNGPDVLSDCVGPNCPNDNPAIVVQPFCGDSVVNTADEECDMGSMNGQDGSGCTADCKVPICGDDMVNTPDEECDEGAMNGQDGSGCTPDCKFPICGDDMVNTPDEECDSGAINGQVGAGCTADCKLPVCGDGMVNTADEDCDDGAMNGQEGSDCTSDCKLAACGDGVVNSEGEECDEGAMNGQEGSGCTAGCKLPACGDQMVNSPDEECDEGAYNGLEGSGCTADCKLPICGDDMVNGPGEECDEGPMNGQDGSGCTADCKLPICGDDMVNSPGEECDEGPMNGQDGSGCTADCKLPICGDDMVNSPGEECDEGAMNGQDGSGCTADCKLPICGDDMVNSPDEECDEGPMNGQEGSGCTADCKLPICGDDMVNTPDEECDEGAMNGQEGSGCTADCKLPICGDGMVNGPDEECDEGAMNGQEGSSCNADCTIVVDCPEVVLDFNDLPIGGFLYDEWEWTKGVKVIAVQANSAGYTPHPKDGCDSSELECYCNFNPSNPTSCSGWQPDITSGGAARVFNTNKPRGYSSSSYEYKMGFDNPMCDHTRGGDGDTDLGSPNESCGGPGEGGHGAFDQPYANCPVDPIGNVLILQEGKKTCPDDIGSPGGSITFEFNPEVAGTVEFTYGRFIDIDDGHTNPELFFYHPGDSNHFRMEETEPTGENGLYDMTFNSNPTNVQRVTIVYPGSGCIAEIRFKPSKCPVVPVCGNGVVEGDEECDDGNAVDGDGCSSTCEEECPEIVVDFNDLPSGGFIYDEWEDSKGIKVIAAGRNSKSYTPKPKSGCDTASLDCYCDWNPSSPNSCSNWQADISSGGAARVFDTSRPEAHSNPNFHNEMCAGTSNGDDDLGSPSEHCDAIGMPVGPGNQAVSDVQKFYANCPETPIGHVLIIQENPSTCPDDVGSPGGTISFEFDTSMHGGVYFTFSKFLDIDDGVKNPFIEFWKVGHSNPDDSLKRFTERTGENGLLDMSFPVPPSDIKKIRIDYPGSGCIAEIRFRPTMCPEVRHKKQRGLRGLR